MSTPLRTSGSRGRRRALAALCALSAACGDDASGPADGAPTLRLLAGDAQVGLEGVPLRDSLVVVAERDGRPLAGVRVSFEARGPGTVDPPQADTDAQGRAWASWTPGAGPDSVEAASGDAVVRFRGRGETTVPVGAYLGRQGYVEYRPGTLPLVLSAPHGGTLEPEEIPDRTVGTLVRDTNTDLLARAVADALEARTGHRPHLVVSRLHRRKLDPNRDLTEAAQGHPLGEQAWREYHALVEYASRRVEETAGTGLYVDLHGHGHPLQRLELGYLLDADDLARSDADLDQGPWGAGSSVRRLLADAGVALSVLVRGPDALGSLLEAAGIPATPSDVQPDPGPNPFFSGGYSTARHGSAQGGPVSAVQIETHYAGVRDTPEARAAFAEALADVLAAYLERWFGPQAARAPAPRLPVGAGEPSATPAPLPLAGSASGRAAG